MADITWTNVTDHVATLSTVGAAAQADILAVVNATFDTEVFDGETGPTTKLARIYLAAHMATLETQGGSGGGVVGPVVSESAGRLSRSYSVTAAMNGADGDLELTRYGRLLRQLIRATPARAGMVL